MAERSQPHLQNEIPTPLQGALRAIANQKQKTNYLVSAWQQRRCANMYRTSELMEQQGEDMTKYGKMLEDEAKQLAKHYMAMEERHRILVLKTKNFINDAKTFYTDVESQHRQLGYWDAANSANKRQMTPTTVGTTRPVGHFTSPNRGGTVWDSPSFLSLRRSAVPSLDTFVSMGRGARRRPNSSS